MTAEPSIHVPMAQFMRRNVPQFMKSQDFNSFYLIALRA